VSDIDEVRNRSNRRSGARSGSTALLSRVSSAKIEIEVESGVWLSDALKSQKVETARIRNLA
jgi:hypothetical protein